MKYLMNTVVVFFVILLLVACANNNKNEVLNKSMYEGLNLLQKMDNPEAVLPPEQEPPSYEQYKKERQEMLRKAKGE